MSERDVVKKDINYLKNFDYTNYPALSWLMETKEVQPRLEAIMKLMLSYEFPVWPQNNRRKYYLFSMPYLKKWAKKECNLTGSEMVWQGTVVMLEDAGLIKRLRVRGPSPDPFLNSLWERAVENARNKHIYIRTESLWTVGKYTPELFQEAEKILSLYKNAGLTPYHLRKSDVIRLRGREVADRLYEDRRGISLEELTVRSYMKEATEQIVNQKGYARPTEIESLLRSFLSERLHFTFPDVMKMNDWTAEDIEEYNKEKKYWKEVKKLARKRKSAFIDFGFNYRQATKEMRARYQIVGQAWIVIKNDQ